MAQPQNFEFPYFPFPPPHTFPSPPIVPPPFHPISPPSPHLPPFPAPSPPKPSSAPPSPLPKPPPHHVSPPTPAAEPPKPSTPPSPIPKPSPPHHYSPPTPSPKLPPPHPSLPPPPPHVVPTPPLPPPAPGHHGTIIIVVFVSLGGLFLLAFLSVALFCFIKKRRKKMIHESDDFQIDERMKVHETIVPGPHGEKAVLVTFEEDIHVHETKIKDEIVGETSHANSAHHPHSLDIGPSTLSRNHHHIENRIHG